MAASVAKGLSLNYISRDSSDIRQQIFGLEEIESPNFVEFTVIWLNLSSAFQLYLIERNLAPSFQKVLGVPGNGLEVASQAPQQQIGTASKWNFFLVNKLQ
ncbi:glyoxylase I 4 [Fagus crenata]